MSLRYSNLPGPELLTAAEMYRADAFAIKSGIAGRTLMENAGRAVADAICARYGSCPTAVLCGPGNNGGDGFVVARLLAERGWPVTVALLGRREALAGDAAEAAALWTGPTVPLAEDVTAGAGLVVDALFGAGLSRPLDGVAAALAATHAGAHAAAPAGSGRRGGATLVAIDVPSGIDGSTGQAKGPAFRADLTVTFFRAKPGHFLLPGRTACGEVTVADIGIPDAALAEISPSTWHNEPALWRAHFARPAEDGHKYARGHAVVVSGPATRTGAARLAARGALRAGAGLVTVATPPSAAAENAAHLTAVMLAEIEGPPTLEALLQDAHKNAVLIGPGAGTGAITRALTLAALRRFPAAVLDADALTAFADEPETLWRAIASAAVITPHEGEFARLFPGLVSGGADRLSRARDAAALSRAVVVLKGPDTVIAAPDGRAVINSNAPASLATAGTGDVLAGMILAQLAQGVDAFTAGCIGVWLHGAAASAFGVGLIAEDLPEMLPEVLEDLHMLLEGEARP